MNLDKLRDYVYNRADVYCNQKYAGNLPYSFHLDCVEKQGKKFLPLIETKDFQIVLSALITHDSIEDHRMTYNDVAEVVSRFYDIDERSYSYIEDFGKKVADIVYAVTDEKGKSRAERKNEKYYKELKENKLAVFVKLADLSANTLFSKLTGSSMYEKYKKEFPKFKEKVYIEEYEEFFNYIQNL
jgi:hypothetical protein